LVAEEAFRLCDAPSQMVADGPATAVGAFTTVKVFVSTAFVQPAFIAVKVRVTEPSVASLLPILYVGLAVDPPVNVPLPEEVHVSEV